MELIPQGEITTSNATPVATEIKLIGFGSQKDYGYRVNAEAFKALAFSYETLAGAPFYATATQTSEDSVYPVRWAFEFSASESYWGSTTPMVKAVINGIGFYGVLIRQVK